MKLTSVELHPSGSSAVPVVMSFRDPRRLNSYNVKSIEGLDAEDIVPRFYGSGPGGSSSKFYQLSLEERQIVIQVQLNPTFSTNQTFSDLRDEVYRLIASSRTGLLEVQFKNVAEVTAVISGFVKKVEAPKFTKDPEVHITIDCVGDKLLKAPVATEIDVEALVMSDIVFTDPKSTSPHGFKVQLGVLANTPLFRLDDPTNEVWAFELAPVGGFLEDDILAFSSDVNDKYVEIIRGLSVIHLADVMTPGSSWPIMFHGDNHFRILNHANFEFLNASYFPTYWGV